MSETKGQQRFDGLQIDTFRLRVAGTMDMTDEDAAALPLDGEVVIVVRGRIGQAVVDSKDNGDTDRTNVLKKGEVRLLNGHLLKQIEAELFDEEEDPASQPQLSLVTASPQGSNGWGDGE